MNEPETFGWFMARLGILLIFFFFFFHSIFFSDMNINTNLHEEIGASTPGEEGRHIEKKRRRRKDEEGQEASKDEQLRRSQGKTA